MASGDFKYLELETFFLNGGDAKNCQGVDDFLLKGLFLEYLESIEFNSLEEWTLVNRLGVGVAALQLFIQCNLVGPIPVAGEERHSRIVGVAKRTRHGPDVRLDRDGEIAHPLVNAPWLLLLADDALSFDDPALPSLLWWRFRLAWIHQRVLEEPVASLRDAILEDLLPSLLQSKLYQHLTAPHRALLHLEAYHAYLYYWRSREAAHQLQSAIELSGVDVRVFGALGKRTKYQKEDKCQMVVSVKTESNLTNSEGDWFEGHTWWHEDALSDIALDDDTLLDKVAFRASEDVSGDSLGPLEQAVLFCVMMDVGHRGASYELTEEELAAFRSTLLSQDRKIYAVQLGCLFHRSRGEHKKSRKVERALSQMENLVNELKRPDLTSAGHRIFLAHALDLPFVWTMENLMAEIMTSLGLTRAALDVLLRLEAWPEVVECYQKLGKRGVAEKIIRERLEFTNDPNMICVLGDVTLDASHYEKAWEVSNGSCARAMRSLGYDHLFKHREAEAASCFEKSLQVNYLQIPVWYSLGCASLFIGDNKRAEKAFLRCVHLDYDNYEAWTNLASAQIKLGLKEKACATLQEALKCNYENWRIWENFLVVSADVGHPEDIIRSYHRLLDLKDEKYADGEVLSILVTLVVDLHTSLNNEDTEAVASWERLYKKSRELFGRVTASLSDDAEIWKAYSLLILRSHESPDQTQIGLQHLQRSLRCLTQKSGWENEIPSCEKVLTECNRLVDIFLSLEHSITSQQLSSLKMTLRTTVAKLMKKYGEVLPSSKTEQECDKMKEMLSVIDEKVKLKKLNNT